jgi:hypothetical protein
MKVNFALFFSVSSVCAYLVYPNAVASADEIDMATLTQLYYTANTSISGVSPDYTQSASPNLLTVSSLPNLPPPPPTEFYNTQNLTPFQLSGDFSASVTVIPGANLEGGAGGGLQAQFQSATGGFSSGNIFGQEVSANYGFGPAAVTTPGRPNSLSSVVINLERTGDVFNVFASTNQGFVKLLSLTGTNVSAPAVLDLVANVTEGTVKPQTLTFTNFYVLSGNGGTLEGLTGGTVTNPIPLPSATVESVTGEIGGPAPSSDYYSFYWKGGEFDASVDVADAEELSPQPTYTFELCQGTSCADVVQETVANNGNGWESSLSASLAPGYYTVGIINDSAAPDPSFSITFNTPISQVAGVPEPSTWALLLLGFAGLGIAGYRVRRNSAVVA